MESLPEGIQSNPQQLGSLLYSCVTLAHEEARMLHEALPRSPFQVSILDCLTMNSIARRAALQLHLLSGFCFAWVRVTMRRSGIMCAPTA